MKSLVKGSDWQAQHPDIGSAHSSEPRAVPINVVHESEPRSGSASRGMDVRHKLHEVRAEQADKKREIKLLYLFAGPARKGDAEEMGRQLGMDVVRYDTQRSKHHHLLDDLIWDGIIKDVEAGVYDGVLMAPPCGTFCRALRGEGPTGPRSIRTIFKPYGVKDMSPQEKEAARVGTALALRALDMAGICESRGIPWLVETSGKYRTVLN